MESGGEIWSRRGLLLAAAAGFGCGRQKATSFHGNCFIANQEGRTVAVVSLSRFRVVQQIALDAAPSMVLPHAGTRKVYVLAPETGTVYEIDAVSLAVTRRARAGNQALGMKASPDGRSLWVLYRDPAALIELPLDSLRPRRRIKLPAPPDGFDLSQREMTAVANWKDGSIALASLQSASIERTIGCGAEPSIVSFQADGQQLIVGSRPAKDVAIFHVATGRIVVRLPLPVEPHHFCFNSDGGQLFISGSGMDAVVIVFPYTTEVDQSILAGHAPGAMAVTAGQQSFLLVANPESNSITVLDVETRKLVAVVQVGQGPGQIVITPDGQYALVLNGKSGDLAVIRILSLTLAPNGSQRRYKTAPLFTLIPVGEKPVAAAVVGL